MAEKNLANAGGPSPPSSHLVCVCESCGKEVPLLATRCPHCRTALGNMVCQNCHFEAAPIAFSSGGCPQCGHILSNVGLPQGKPSFSLEDLEVHQKKRRGTKESKDFSILSYAWFVLFLLTLLVVFFIYHLEGPI